MSLMATYYDYLCGRLGINPCEMGIESVCSLMLVCPFYAVMPDDENQIEQALYMRREYARQLSNEEKTQFYRAVGPCSVFEIVVILVEKLRYNLIGNPLANNQPALLFLELLDNLGVSWVNDRVFAENPGTCSAEIEGALEVFVNREYGPCGEDGGLFPVEKARSDMREMSLHRQMEEYLIDRFDALR